MKKLLLILVMLQVALAGYAPGQPRDPRRDMETYLRDYAPFTIENLKLAIDLNRIVAPEVVLAQSRLETGHFRSDLCRGHNNLFGMKLARRRPTTALGSTEKDYAAYRTWYDSVKDVKLFQQWYLARGMDMTDYFGFLASIGYAEDPHYLNKLKQLCITY